MKCCFSYLKKSKNCFCLLPIICMTLLALFIYISFCCVLPHGKVIVLTYVNISLRKTCLNHSNKCTNLPSHHHGPPPSTNNPAEITNETLLFAFQLTHYISWGNVYYLDISSRADL